MEHPEAEIERVVQMLMNAASPDVQQAAVRKCVLSKILAPEESSSGRLSGISLRMPAFDILCIP